LTRESRAAGGDEVRCSRDFKPGEFPTDVFFQIGRSKCMPKRDEARGQVRGRYEGFDPGDSDLEAVGFELKCLPGESDVGSDLVRRKPQFQPGTFVEG